MIRVLICDDQTLVSEGLQLLLETDPDVRVVGVASDGAHALELLADIKVDVVLMDLQMPGMNGIEATSAIRQRYPALPVIILTAFDDDGWVMDAIRSGASGYLLKGISRPALIQSVKETVRGKAFLDPAVAGKVLTRLAQPEPATPSRVARDLSEREHEILRLIAQGVNNAGIARTLYLSEGTVRNYVTSIFSKLNVNDRTQAAVMALRYGLVS